MKAMSKQRLAGYAGVSVKTLMSWCKPYMQELERTIRRDPALWLWSHDRWSRTKEEFDIRWYVKDGKVYEKVTEEEYAKMMGWRSYWHH